MDTDSSSLVAAIAITALRGPAARKRELARRVAMDGLAALSPEIPEGDRDSLESHAESLHERGISACMLGDHVYPVSLARIGSAPPVLFTLGNIELLNAPAVGMCGSRNASPQGLAAALTCGEEVAAQGLTVVSGYAKGVDTQTHLAALRSGGRTLIVLAEGIEHFRQKRDFAETGLPMDRVLVVSQFPPRQRWTVHGAMTRNGVIAGLARALVVVEAQEKGGTVNAGFQALRLGRPVLALQFSSHETPAGNEALFEKGARRIQTRQELARELRLLEEDDRPHQLGLL
jgi:DNA processing protein